MPLVVAMKHSLDTVLKWQVEAGDRRVEEHLTPVEHSPVESVGLPVDHRDVYGFVVLLGTW
jgi:hypothetical protein